MNVLMRIIIKICGVDGLLLRWLNGSKMYTGGAIQALTGLAAMAGSAVSILTDISKLETSGALIAFVEKAASGNDPHVLAFMAALAFFGKGLSDIGSAHKHEKLASTLNQKLQ